GGVSSSGSAAVVHSCSSIKRESLNMRKLFTLIAAGALVLGASAASAAPFQAQSSLSVQIGTLPAVGFTGATVTANSDGNGLAATLPAGALSGVFSTAINPPLLTLLDGIGVGASGGWPGGPAVNNVLSFDGTNGTMSLNASAYLLMGGVQVAEIPLGVVGVGGTQTFHVLSLVAGNIFANPYQLGMVTLMGQLNGVDHTIVGTGVDNRNPDGSGTLVLISPTTVSLGPIGQLAALATLTLTYAAPEPGAMLLGAAALASLLAGARRKRTA